MKKQLFLLALLFCGQLTMFSQYAIRGTVKDEKGNALIGANVVVEGTSYGVTTNLKGEFLLKSMQPGDYIIQFSYVGFEPLQKTVSVKADMSIDAVLTAKVYMADEVIISAVRAGNNMPVTKSTIKKEDIAARNLGQDIPYLMTLAPSVVTSSDAGTGIGYTNFRIRGTDLNRINITVNGIPLNDAESHGVFWVNMPDFASSVENIQIQRGVGTSTQGGGAFGATINLQTLSINKKPYAEIANSAGSFNTFKHSVSFGSGLINNHFTFDGRLSKITSDGFIDRARSDLQSFYLSGAYYSEKSLLKMIVSSGLEETYQAWQGIPSVRLNSDVDGMLEYVAIQADWKEIEGDAEDISNILNANPRTYNMYRYKDQVDHYNQTHYQALFSHSFSSSLSLNTALHYTRGKGYYEQYKTRQKFSDYWLDNVVIGSDTIKRTTLGRRKWLDNDFYGITWALNYSASNVSAVLGGGWNKYDGDHYGRLRWAKLMSNAGLDHEFYFGNGVKTDFNIFSKITAQIGERFSLFGDLQLRRVQHKISGLDDDHRDISQDHDFIFFNPKAGLTFHIAENQSIYGYAGIAHREPNRDNFVDADPLKPTPKPERLMDYEVGYNFNSQSFQAGINLYYMDYNDQLVLTGMINDVGAPVMVNVDKSYRAGVELTTGIKLARRLTWSGNATFSRNIVKNFTEYVDNWDTWVQESIFHKESKLAFSPELTAGSLFTFNYKPFSASFTSKYVGKQYIDNTQSEDRKLDPYFVSDFRVNLNFALKSMGTVELIMSVNNIFDEMYESNAWIYRYSSGGSYKVLDGYFPQAGRNYMAGLVVRF